MSLLLIDPDYPSRHVHFNRDMCVLIINRESNKIEKVAVIIRERLHEYVRTQSNIFPEKDFEYLVAGICVTGRLLGFQEGEVQEKAPTTNFN